MFVPGPTRTGAPLIQRSIVTTGAGSPMLPARAGAMVSNSKAMARGRVFMDATTLMPRHFRINLLAPDGDAAFDALEILEALLPQEVQGLQQAFVKWQIL